jgi:putative ABC transport system ATP-binding protein
MLTLTHLYKTYRTGHEATPTLSDVSLQVRAGEFVAIMGPSGCGKSTLLNVLGLLDEVDSGQYIFEGTDLLRLSEREKDHFRQKNIGFVFQSFNLIEELTLYENVELPLAYAGFDRSTRRDRVTNLLENLQLMHRRHHHPAQLSGGQQQRAALARALVNQPRLILADEPTGNLDSTNREVVMRLLTDINEAGTTVVMVTHSDMDALYAHRVVQMHDGTLLS